MYKRLLPLALAALLLAAGVSLAADIIRPETGTFIVPLSAGGFGELSITDAAPMDALAVLMSQNNQQITSVYIRSGESYNIKGINDGMYFLYYKLGQNLSSSTLHFSEKESFYRWEAPLSFSSGPSQDGIDYTSRSVALNEEGKGSAWISSISESAFPRIR